MRYLIALISGLLFGVLTSDADASCHKFFCHKQVVVQQVAVPVYYATVSPGLVNEAIIQKAVKQAVGEAVQAFQSGQLRIDGQTLQQSAAPSAFAKCIRCHSEGKSDLVLDGRKLSCDQYHRFDEIFMLRENIPPQMKALVESLSQEEMGAMKEAIVRMGKPVPADKPPPPPVPSGGLE